MPSAIRDDRTPRGWPLPHADNYLEDDVDRLRDTLTFADADLTELESFAQGTSSDLARVDREKADEASVQSRLDAKADENSVARRFLELEHDDLNRLNDGIWRHLTPLQLAAFPELAPGDKLSTEAGMIPVVDLGAEAGKATARLPEVSGLWASVKGLGLFRLDGGSAAFVDGETSILPASGEGRWLMQSPAADWMAAAQADLLTGTVKAVLEFGSVTAWSRKSADIPVPTFASMVLRVDPPPALAGCDYTWTAKDAYTQESQGGAVYAPTGSCTVTVTYQNRTDTSVTPASGEWTATYLSPAAATAAALRFLRWLQKAGASGAEIDAALADAGKASAFADFLDSPQLFQRAFGAAGTPAALFASVEAMRGVVGCERGVALLAADNAASQALFAEMLAAQGFAGTLTAPKFWAAASSVNTYASAVMNSAPALGAVLASRTAMSGVGARSSALLSQICASQTIVNRLCADGDLLANLALSAYGLTAINSSQYFFNANNEAFARRLYDHAEVREAAFSVNTLQGKANTLRGYLSGWGWTLADTARETAVTADGDNRSPGWSGPGLAFICLGYASPKTHAAVRTGIRYGEAQAVPNAARGIMTPSNFTASGANCFFMPAGGWEVTVEASGAGTTGAYYAELWVPPGSE